MRFVSSLIPSWTIIITIIITTLFYTQISMVHGQVFLSIAEIEEILSSDVGKEFGVNELDPSLVNEAWKFVTEYNWERARQAEVHSDDDDSDDDSSSSTTDSYFPFIVCVRTVGQSALERKKELESLLTPSLNRYRNRKQRKNQRKNQRQRQLENLFFNLNLDEFRPYYNFNDQSCYSIRLPASVASELAAFFVTRDIRVIPAGEAVKIREGLVQSILKRAKGLLPNSTEEIDEEEEEEEESVSSRETQLYNELCSGLTLEELETMGQKVNKFLTARSPDGSMSLVRYNSPYANITCADLDDITGISKRAKFWCKIMENGIDSPNGCTDMVSNLTYEVVDWKGGDDDGAAKAFVVSLTKQIANTNNTDSQDDSEDDSEVEDSTTSVSCLMSLVIALARMPQICSVGLNEITKTFNDEAQWIVQGGTEENQNRHFWDMGIRGDGQVASVSDTGLDLDNCYFWDRDFEVPKDGTIDLRPRKVVQYDPFVDRFEEFQGHGTHVAGTVCGSRATEGRGVSDGAADGVAPNARLAFIDCSSGGGSIAIPRSKSRLIGTGSEAGARLHSASWGSFLNPYTYTSDASATDNFLYTNWDYLMLVAAGNSGSNDALRTIGSPAVGKNVLTVGASESIGNGLRGIDYLAFFSSRGPAPDGRIKPDVVAPGHRILSASADPLLSGECDDNPSTSQTTNLEGGTTFKSGTSMATPATTGAALLIRQYYMEGWSPTGIGKNITQSFIPSGMLIKATLINGAREIVGVNNGNGGGITPSSYYDEHQGFGRIDLLQSLPLNTKNTFLSLVVDAEDIMDGDVLLYNVTINTRGGSCSYDNELRATLVWADPPALGGCRRCLINDLDLTITNDETSQTYYPNGKSSKDSINNVERIIVSDVSDGDTYTISVTASNLDRSSQVFALIATGCLSEGSGDRGDAIVPSSAFSMVLNDGSKRMMMMMIVVVMTTMWIGIM